MGDDGTVDPEVEELMDTLLDTQDDVALTLLDGQTGGGSN